MPVTDRTPARRDVLVAGTGALAALLAGCSTRSSGRQSPPPPGTTAPPATTTGTDARTDTATGAPATETGTSDGILLPSLDVGGSPGGLVPLQPDGVVALLDFFATWCAPCKPQMAHLRAVRERYDAEQVAVVSITQERDEAAIRSFWTEYRGTWPVVRDPGARAARRYDVTTIPTLLVLAPDGTVVRRHTGLVREPRLVDAIEAALATDAGRDDTG